ncbi:MAG: GtrA family protein [Erysipelotrichaceae bacterium]|nr:GtrA family protein [Erysipelotrichaceae bacterium]
MLKTLIIVGIIGCVLALLAFALIKPLREFVIDFCKKNRELVTYVIVGCMTTVVSFVTLFIFHTLINMRVEIANIFSWIIAVLFSFIMNKFVVFESKEKDLKKLLKEFFEFVAARIASFFVDEGLLILGCDVLHWNAYVVKCISEVFVVAINYFFSKYVVFKKK